jgi:hypothetical protein
LGVNVPILGVSAQAIFTRAAFFKDRIDAQLGSAALRGVELLYHSNAPELLAHVYYGLSEAYKTIYLTKGNRTDPLKRAAITCAAISAVRPIRPPLSMNNIEKEEYIYVNSMFGVRCASSIVGRVFDKRPHDDRRRIFRSLAGFSFPSVDPIIEEARKNNGAITTEFQLNISTKEESDISILIELFWVYQYLKIPEQWENR